MKVAIAYYSQHHGNTKKLLDAIKDLGDIKLINVVAALKNKTFRKKKRLVINTKTSNCGKIK